LCYPREEVRKGGVVGGLELNHFLDGFKVAEFVWNVKALEDEGEWSVPTADPLHRGLKAKEAIVNKNNNF
jgi:hypothetical protein